MNNEQHKFLITGSQGQLARAFQNELKREGISFVAPAEGDFDITNKEHISQGLDQFQPTVLVNCAAYNDVEKAQSDPNAFLINKTAVHNLSLACTERKILMIHFSTDYVFDGTKGDLYTEDDTPNPLNQYGKSKYEGEKCLQESCKNYLLLRLSWVFGEGTSNFLYKLNTWAKSKKTLKIAADEFSCPTYTEDVVKISLLAIKNKKRGMYHFTNSGCCSRYEWAKYYFSKINPTMDVEPASMKDFPSQVNRPGRSCLSNNKISKELNVTIPTWQDAMDRFIVSNALREKK